MCIHDRSASRLCVCLGQHKWKERGTRNQSPHLQDPIGSVALLSYAGQQELQKSASCENSEMAESVDFQII
jgi:hypothetical protein